MQPKASRSQLPVRSWLLTSRSSARVLAQPATTGHPSPESCVSSGFPHFSGRPFSWAFLGGPHFLMVNRVPVTLFHRSLLSNLPASAERPDERTSRVLSPDFLSSLKVRETQQSLIVSPQAQPSPSPGAPCPQKAPRRGVAPGATGETRSGRPPALCSSRRRLLCPRSPSGLK